MAWLTNWNRRKKININGTTAGAQTAYQMKVTVYYGPGTDTAAKVYCGGNVKGDFSDIRFTDSGGSTLLNYWIESITGTYPNQSATIWVKVLPSIPTGTNSTSIYIYYNNPSAISSSSGTDTFLFFDNFSGLSLDTSKWSSFNKTTGSITVNNGITITPGTTNGGSGIYSTASFTEPIMVESLSKLSRTGNTTWAKHGIGIVSTANVSTIINSYNGDLLSYYSSNIYYCETGGANAISVGNSNSYSQPTKSTINTGNTDDNPHIWGVYIGATQSDGFKDYSHLVGPQSNAYYFTVGRIGYIHITTNRNGGVLTATWIRVRKYISPEPTFSGTIVAEELGTTPVGSLNIRSNPIGARVFIDSIDQVTYTPITITGITPGTHNVTLTKPSYSDYNIQITILAGQTAYLSAPIAIGIVNGSFDTDLSNWTNTIGTGTYSSGYDTFRESSGKAHVRSGSTYGASGEVFVTFWQRFYLDKLLLVFDAQALIADDSYGYACGDILGPSPSGCGWVVTDDSNNVIAYGKPGTTLTTISVDLTNYVNQWLTITFRVGAARCCGYYYEILIDNVMTAYGSTLRAICPDTGQFCNASLYIDNVYAGTTPFKIYLNLGTHNYTLFKNGYNRFDSSINITSTEITSENTTGMNIDSTLVVGPGGIINGTFGIDLNGWTVSGSATWDNGRVHLTNGGKISQIFAISDNLLQFDYETLGHVTQDSGFGYQLYIDDVLKIDKRFFVYGTESVYIGNYIGRTAKILFYEVYGWEGWIDNVRISHTTGIFNGDFESGLIGWEAAGEVSISKCGDWPARWGPPCSGSCAIVGLNDGGSIYQIFILDKCALKFDWLTGYAGAYQIYYGDVLIASGTLPNYSGGTQTVQLADYLGSTLKIILFSSGPYGGSLYVDNVKTITNPYDVSVVSYPSGAEIYIDSVDTGHTTTDSPVTVDGGSEGIHTVTLKLAGYPDYVETINIIRCTTTYVSATFGGCITFITNPPGVKICIDNVDTLEVTPKTFCGYGIGSSHTYSLYLKDYRVEKDTIIFPSDKGFLINKTLTYETGSVRFSVIPNGSNIIIDGVDTGKLTPDIVDNLPIGYHTYEIRKNDYYSLTGSFRVIVDTEKLIAESLQQVTGIENGTFDTNLDGWTLISSNPSQGYVQQINGQAHMVTTDIPITFYKDFTAIEDYLVFYYYPGVTTSHACYMGWSILANPDSSDQISVASYCGYGQTGYSRYEHWGYFEVDISAYKGKIIRLNLNLNGHGPLGVGGPAHAYVDNVGNISNIKRSITFDSNCATLAECPTDSLSTTKCYADVYVDNNYIGIDQISVDNLSIGTHSYKVRNQGYTSVDTNNQDVTGNITFSQGIPAHVYIDNIFLPTGIVPAEGCIRFESLPPGLHIYIDGQDTGKVTPDTVCNITHSLSINTLATHTYELKLLHSSYQGTFDLGPGFGEYVYVEVYGNIQIDTIPEGARVTLDGVDTGGTTPYNTGNIPIGIHTYNLRLDNFQEGTCQIEVIKDETANVNIELVSAEGCIYIDSCPRGSNGWNSTDITLDGTSQGITPLSICGLTGIHNYSLNRVGYDSYSETINMPFGVGINRRIYLNRKIGVPSLDPTKEICFLNSSRVVIQSYVTGGIYLGKDAFEMKDGGIEIIDAQGYDVIHLYILYENFWTGTADGGVWGEVYVYQSDTSGDCSTSWWQTPSAKPADAELIHYRQDGGWWPPGAGVLLDGSLNISKRYIRIETRVYMCNYWYCWGDGNSSIFVMEQIPIECPMAPTTKCEKIVTCKIRTDEGIYSKERYCYLGEGIFTKRAIAPPAALVGTNAISQNCGDWGGAQVDCWIGNDGYLVLENTQFSPGWRYTNFEAKGNYIDFYTPGGLWQLYDITTSTWVVGTGDGYNYGAYISVSGSVHYEIPIANKGHTLQIWFLFPNLHYRYDHIKNIWYA